MSKFGIDISHWQGDFDLQKAKDEHKIEFAILKIGGGDSKCYSDNKFLDFYTQCKNAGIPVGCYFFGQALTLDKAKEESEYWISLMEGLQFELPVFYDVEGKMLELDKWTLTEIVNYVCDSVEKAGYYTGIYMSRSSFDHNVIDTELKRYCHWVASWSKAKPVLNSRNQVQIWQFGGETNLIRTNKIIGVKCDQDYSYIDFEKVIKEKGLNGFKAGSKEEPEKTDIRAVMIDEIIDKLNKLKEVL